MPEPTQNLHGTSPSELGELTLRAFSALKTRRLTISTAESCTGGWLAKQLTEVAGSSTIFDCGFVCYSNAAKTKLLGVPEAALEAYGAVSRETAVAMVVGALERSTADIALSVSGIAGPSGGTTDKPVGTVWIGVGLRGAEPQTERHHFRGDRDAVRVQSVAAALRLINQVLAPG